MNQGYLHAKSSSGECPPFDELWACVQGGLSADRREALNEHLAACSWCAEKLTRLNDDVKSDPAAVPDGLDRRARELWNPSWKRVWQTPWVWMAVFLTALGVSFATPRYYKQFLVIALIAGIRWALSERALRHSITVTRLEQTGIAERHADPNPSRRSV